jgi:hypothetical protein
LSEREDDTGNRREETANPNLLPYLNWLSPTLRSLSD